MKLRLTKTICTVVLLLFVQTAFCQQQNNDSLWHLAINVKSNSIKYELVTNISFDISSAPIDSTLAWAKKQLAYAEKNNDLPIKFSGNILLATVYYRIADYVKAQEYVVKSSTIAEAFANNANNLAIIENFKAAFENDPLKSITHLKKAALLATSNIFKETILTNTAFYFLRCNKIDSALIYAQTANEVCLKRNDSLDSDLPRIFGDIYTKKNQPAIAYAYLNKSIQLAINANLNSQLQAYNSMASYFETFKNNDSAFAYRKKPFMFQPHEAYPFKVESAKWLYEHYLKEDQRDSALKYLLFYTHGNDSLNSSKKLEELQQASIKEELRQRDLEIAKEEENENRHHNLQLAITAIAILSAVILFLLLSRSIIVSHKVVEILGVIVLLVVFEFINLLLHPFLEKITHHSPALMLLALVAIAALIVPLHHRLEHWTTKKLVEKNKAIRLANAKKTIEELEKPTT
jgi:hypothetical protein